VRIQNENRQADNYKFMINDEQACQSIITEDNEKQFKNSINTIVK